MGPTKNIYYSRIIHGSPWEESIYISLLSICVPRKLDYWSRACNAHKREFIFCFFFLFFCLHFKNVPSKKRAIQAFKSGLFSF